MREIQVEAKNGVELPKETKLSTKVLELVAVGVSLAVNCQECLEHHVHKAIENGADEEEVVEAVKVGMMVRSGAASIMDRFVVQEAMKAGCDKFGTEASKGCGCS